VLQCVAVCCDNSRSNMLAVSCHLCCSVLQCLLHFSKISALVILHRTFYRECYNALQCVAVCCSVLQCVAMSCSMMQRGAVRCSVMQCVAVRCNVMQCDAVCFQCVAAYCSALQCDSCACDAAGTKNPKLRATNDFAVLFPKENYLVQIRCLFASSSSSPYST